MCRSDLGGANITGADFTNALVDRTQQIVSPGLPASLNALCTLHRLGPQGHIAKLDQLWSPASELCAAKHTTILLGLHHDSTLVRASCLPC